MLDSLEKQIRRWTRVVLEIQSIMGSLLLNRDGPELCTSLNEDGFGNAWKNKNKNLQRRIQGPLVILEKIRILLLTPRSGYFRHCETLFSIFFCQRAPFSFFMFCDSIHVEKTQRAPLQFFWHCETFFFNFLIFDNTPF